MLLHPKSMHIEPLTQCFWRKKKVENRSKTTRGKCNILSISRIQKNQMLGVFVVRSIVVRKFASYEEIRCQENSSSLTVIRCLSPTTSHDDEFYVCRVFLDWL